MYITTNEQGQQVEHYDGLSEYKEFHPEDFFPIIFDTDEIIVASNESVEIDAEIEEISVNDSE